MAIYGMSTIGTALMVKEGGVYKQVIPITSYPDLGGDPELIQITTLQHRRHVNVNGVQDSGSFQFGANYTAENYTRLSGLADAEKEYSLWFGGTGEGDNFVPTGADGKFDFKGMLSFYVTGNGVNEARGITFSIAVSSEITFSADTNSITLNTNSVSLTAGSTYALSATTVPNDATVTWTTLNSGVATVSGGTITAVAAGRTKIIADIDVSGVTYTAICDVTVVGTSG